MDLVEHWWIWTCANCGIQRPGVNESPCPGCQQTIGVRRTEVVPSTTLQGAVEEAERLRTALAGLLIYARGNQHVLDKIHAALDRPSGGR